MAADTQTLVNKYLHKAGYGGLTRLARKANVSKSAISRFRHGKYDADSAKLEQKLRAVLDDAQTKARIASGALRVTWLVNTRDGLRLVRNRNFLHKLRDAYPEAHVINVWTGQRPEEIYFTEEGDPTGDLPDFNDEN